MIIQNFDNDNKEIRNDEDNPNEINGSITI